MVIVEIIIVVGIYTFILLRMPQFRLAGGIVAVALLGGLFYYLFANEQEPQAELRRVTPDEITLSALELEIGVRTSTLKGRVINQSDAYDLTGIMLDVTLYDCPSMESDLSDCFTIGQDEDEARVSVPPGQLRDFTSNLLFVGLPEIIGEFRWTHEITAVRALETKSE